jgi:phosphatidate cytidylyltransferase
LIFFLGTFELLSTYKSKPAILFLDLVLILSLYSIYFLTEGGEITFSLLLWVIILCICSDVGGYAFGKIFKWKQLTKISPKKTFSGVFGSFVFSLLSLILISIILPQTSTLNFFEVKYFFLAIILSIVAQVGDLIISYFKRKEKIKDTGTILPGHGGIFDRIDGLMFVIIMTIIFYKFNIIP